MSNLLTPSLLVLALAATAGAQRTWVVDAGGTGNFKDLPAALQAAKSGDTVFVKRGHYTPGRVSGKALRLIGETGATIDYKKRTDTFLIENVGATGVVTIRGFTLFPSAFSLPGFTAALDLRGIAGRVHIDRLTVTHQKVFSMGVNIENCKAVTIENSAVFGAVSIVSSRVSLAHCTLHADVPPAIGPVTMALRASRSVVELAQCTVTGSSGCGHAPALEAIRCHATKLTIRGDASSTIASGRYCIPSIRRPPAIDGGNSSELRIDPSVRLFPTTNRIVGFTKITRRRTPSLTLSGGALGATLDLNLYSEKGHFWFLWGALPHTPTKLPWGDLWLDLRTLYLYGTGVQGPTQHTRVRIPLPNIPSLRGVAYAFTAWSGRLATLEYSNPAAVVFR